MSTTVDLETNVATAQINAPGKYALIGTPLSDEVPPTTQIIVEGEPLAQPDWYTGPVTVTITAEDNPGGVGLAGTEYSADGGATWQPYTGPFTISQVGTTFVAARSWDEGENLEEPPVGARVVMPIRVYLPALFK